MHFGMFPPHFAPPPPPRVEVKPVQQPIKKIPPPIRFSTDEVQELNREFIKEKMDRPEVMFLY